MTKISHFLKVYMNTNTGRTCWDWKIHEKDS